MSRSGGQHRDPTGLSGLSYELSQAALQEQVDEALSTLSALEAGVLALRFNLERQGPMTLDEVGRRYGVTRERIRQIQDRALSKLRASASSDLMELRQDLLSAPEAVRDRIFGREMSSASWTYHCPRHGPRNTNANAEAVRTPCAACPCPVDKPYGNAAGGTTVLTPVDRLPIVKGERRSDAVARKHPKKDCRDRCGALVARRLVRPSRYLS